MKHERTITLHVVNWPRFLQRVTFPLDARLFPAERDLRRHAEGRFGPGRLRRIGADAWEYERRLPGPTWFWRGLALLLNRSYA